MKLPLDDGDEHVGADGAPDLRLHGVLARAQKFLDPQMLLDPLEEQLHLPAALVQSGDGQRWQGRVLVRNTSVLPVSGSLNRMRRNCSG